MLIGFTCLFIMKILSVLLTLLVVLATVRADLSQYYNGGDNEGQDYDNYQEEGARPTSRGRTFTPSKGVDFSGCTQDPDSGMCCVMKDEEIQTLEKDPILECTHKNTEQCHYTYVTQFKPSREEVCEESFDKKCSITFVKQARNETIEKCYTPLVKVCGKAGGRRRRRRYKKNTNTGDSQTCQTYYETSCTTRYIEKTPGKFVADSSCEKLPVELCGEGCRVKEGREECHQKVVASLLDVPEEVCDLNPVKTCRFATKLVPHLSPTHQCTIVPKEVCVLKFSTPRQVSKPLISKWCLDTSDPLPGESYDESNASGAPLGPLSSSGSQSNSVSDIPSGDEDLDTHSPQSQETEDSNHGASDTALDSYGDQQIQAYAVGGPALESGETAGTAETSEPTLETYLSPSGEQLQDTDEISMEKLDEIREAEESYIVPEAEQTADISQPSFEIYKSPPNDQLSNAASNDNSDKNSVAVDSYVVPEPDESYSEPSQFYESSPQEEEESYGSSSETEESLEIQVEESYGVPSSSDDENQLMQSDISAYVSPSEEVEAIPPNSLYENPSYDYEYDLESYKANEIPSYQKGSPALTEYKIDAGYGEESQFSYKGRGTDVSGQSPGLQRHLAPPGKDRTASKSKENKIRSVNPYYYRV